MKLPALLLAFLFCLPAFAQDENKVLVPKSMLTEKQLAEAEKGDLKTNVHEWAGLGREVGEAVNSSLSAITEQANAFAKTGCRQAHRGPRCVEGDRGSVRAYLFRTPGTRDLSSAVDLELSQDVPDSPH